MDYLAWFIIIGHSITLLIVISILKKNIKNGSNPKANETRTISKYEKTLYLISTGTFIVIISVTICQLTLPIPFICKHTFRFTLAAAISTRYWITGYQIVRLQYIFSESQTHSKKYGYPKWLFIILYIYLVLSLIQSWVMSSFCYDVVLISHNVCIATWTKVGQAWFIYAGINYYVYDLTVLFLYIFKICIIKKIKKSTKNNVDAMDKTANTNALMITRINYILTKITILTSLYQINSITVQVLITTRYGNNYQNIAFFRILLQFMAMLDAINSVLVMHLMIEHNDKHYQKLLRILNKCGICNCFDTIIQSPDETIINSSVPNSSSQKIENTDNTNTQNKVQMNHETHEFSEQSLA